MKDLQISDDDHKIMKNAEIEEFDFESILNNEFLYHRPSEPLVILFYFNSVFSESILYFRSHHFFD